MGLGDAVAPNAPLKEDLPSGRRVAIISSDLMRMSTGSLDELISSRCRAQLIRVFVAAAPGQEFTKRELGDLLQFPRSSLTPEVQRLARLGVIQGRLIGSAMVYRVEETTRLEVLRRFVEEFDEAPEAEPQLDLFSA